MARLILKGYIVTVYTEYDVYEYLFEDIADAHENAQDYINAGCQATVSLAYTIN